PSLGGEGSSRRGFFQRLMGATAGMTMAIGAAAQTRDWQGRTPVRYPDPDIVTLQERFRKYRVELTSIQRLYTGTQWAEGPAWHSGGRYLLWSDIPRDRQLRWLDDDGHVSTMRPSSGNSNGNTFDWQGRQISCEHANRRVVRYEHNGKVTVLVDRFE